MQIVEERSAQERLRSSRPDLSRAHRDPRSAARPAPPSTVWQGATLAVLGYLMIRLGAIAVLWLDLDRSSTQLWQILTTSYDSEHLLGIAENGYDTGLGRRSNLAFFPLYPLLSRAVGTVIGIPAAGLLISWLAGAACAAALFAVGRHVGRPRVGIILALLWAALPHAITQSLAYTETLFTALAAWALVAVLRKQWLLAGCLTLVAGLARPTASALIAVVGIAALVELYHRRGRGWRIWLGAALAPWGWLGYLWWVNERSVEPGGWFSVQQRWGSAFDGGGYSLGFFLETLLGGQSLQMVVVSIVLASAVVLLILSLRDRLPWQLVLFGAAVVALTITTGGFYQSKARLILPAFTLLIPIATRLARAHRAVVVIVLVVAAVVSAQYGTYLMIDAPRSP